MDTKSIEVAVRGIWRIVRAEMDKMPTSIRRLVNELGGALVAFLAVADTNPDRREKRQVYLALAGRLAERTGLRVGACLAAVHAVCAERDPMILEDGEGETRETGRALDVARGLLVSVKVRYEPASGQTWTRQIEVWEARDGKPTVTRIAQDVDWDWLPDDVREQRLRQGNATIVFTLLPKGS
jgi:hypothetical protein